MEMGVYVNLNESLRSCTGDCKKEGDIGIHISRKFCVGLSE